MAKEYKEILSAEYKGEKVEKSELDLIFADIKKLASTPNPVNKYEIGQIVGHAVKHILDTNVNYLQYISDLKDGARGDKPEFKVPFTGVTANIQAKGSTPVVSRIVGNSVVLSLNEVAARPRINSQDLVQRPEMIMDIISESVIAMENAMVQNIQNVCYTAFSALTSTVNFNSGAGIVQASIDAQLIAMQRFGQCNILGDITELKLFTPLTGYNNRVAEKYMVEGNESRFIGTYSGANLVELTNRFLDESSMEEDNLVLRDDLVYILPAGNPSSRPLKVFKGGTLRTEEKNIPETEEFELYMRLDFGVGIVGTQKRMAVYENESE